MNRLSMVGRGIGQAEIRCANLAARSERGALVGSSHPIARKPGGRAARGALVLAAVLALGDLGCWSAPQGGAPVEVVQSKIVGHEVRIRALRLQRDSVPNSAFEADVDARLQFLGATPPTDPPPFQNGPPYGIGSTPLAKCPQDNECTLVNGGSAIGDWVADATTASQVMVGKVSLDPHAFPTSPYPPTTSVCFAVSVDPVTGALTPVAVPAGSCTEEGTGVPYDPTHDLHCGASAGEGADKCRLEFRVNLPGSPPWTLRFQVVAALDSDDDGLLDLWETTGIDVDGDGCIDFKPADFGATPTRKDVFVEIDAMACAVANGDCATGDLHDHVPSLGPDGLQPVIDAFAQAPLTNAMGAPNGINLVIQLDERIPHSKFLESAQSLDIERAFFGTAAERVKTIGVTAAGAPCTTTPDAVLRAKGLVFRYNVWGHLGKSNDPRNGYFAGFDPSGFADRFVITLFNPDFPAGLPAALQRVGQGAFMHELGHSLGLKHGGGDRFNFKPNYLSVMNYLFNSGVLLFSGSTKLDYSRDALPDRFETGGPQICIGGQCFDSLIEWVGIAADPNFLSQFTCPNGTPSPWTRGDSNFDWNCNLVGPLAGVRTYPFLNVPILSVPSDTEMGVVNDINGDRNCVDSDKISKMLHTPPQHDDFVMGGVINAGNNGALQSGLNSPGPDPGDLVVAVPTPPPPVLIGFPDRVLLPGVDGVLRTAKLAGTDDEVIFLVKPRPGAAPAIVAGGDDEIILTQQAAINRLTSVYGAGIAAQLASELPSGIVPLLIAGPTMDSNLGGDQLVPIMIVPGPDGVLETADVSGPLVGDDRRGMTAATPPVAQIEPGPDGIVQTKPAGDDVLMGAKIVDGPDRVCNSPPVSPDEASLEDGDSPRQVGSRQQDRLTGWDDWHHLDYRGHAGGGNGAPTLEPSVGDLIRQLNQMTRADLALSVTASQASASAASPVTYHVTVSNNGPDAALNAVVSAAVPAGLTFDACRTSANGACSNWSASFASIPSGGSATVDFTARVACGAAPNSALQLTVGVVALSSDPSPGNNTATVSTTVTGSKPSFTFVPQAMVTSQCTAALLGTATAEDACGATVTVTNNRPSRFPLGRTVVTWTATSSSGASATATQLVTAYLGDDDSCCPVGSHKIVGTSNNDVLTGTSGADCILALGGQDRVSGGGGDDVISGGDGDDVLDGGDGNDKIYGGAGQDTLTGGNGNDLLYGGIGDDTCSGGAGLDTIFGGQGQDHLFGDAGNDSLYGEGGSDILNGGDGDDYLEGGQAGATGGTTDQCTGGAGIDVYVSCPVRPDDLSAPDACSDNASDGGETGLDCGGSGCLPCAGSGGCQSGADCVSGVCAAGLCTTASTPLYATLMVTADWGAGYCATLFAANMSTVPTVAWSVRIDTNQSTISSSSVGIFDGTSGSVLVTPPTNQRVIAAGARNGSISFCANRQGPASNAPLVINRGATF